MLQVLTYRISAFGNSKICILATTTKKYRTISYTHTYVKLFDHLRFVNAYNLEKNYYQNIIKYSCLLFFLFGCPFYEKLKTIKLYFTKKSFEGSQKAATYQIHLWFFGEKLDIGATTVHSILESNLIPRSNMWQYETVFDWHMRLTTKVSLQ